MRERTISVKLPSELAVWLTARAEKAGRTQSAIVEEALERLAKEHNGPSFFELTQDLAGCLEGPSNLSTRKIYRKRYGR